MLYPGANLLRLARSIVASTEVDMSSQGRIARIEARSLGAAKVDVVDYVELFLCPPQSIGEAEIEIPTSARLNS